MDTIEQLKNAYHDLVKYHNSMQDSTVNFSNSDECKNIFDNLLIIQNEINKIENENHIILEKRKADLLITGVVKMITDHPRYIYSDACTMNLDLYFKSINKINELMGK
jgi:hypothetical protein